MLDIHFAFKLISCSCCCVMIWLTLSLYDCSNIRYVRILICCHKELLKSSLWSNSGRSLVTVTVWPLSLTVKYRKTSCNLQTRVYRDVTVYSLVQIALHSDPFLLIMEAACSSTVDMYPPNHIAPHCKRLQYESGMHPEFLTGGGVDLEAINILFHFKHYVIKTISNITAT